MSLLIHKTGPLSLVQDEGRRGQQHLGLSQGGAIDQHAYFWANHLLANKNNAACLEITLGPFIAEFREPSYIAVTGADLHCTINDTPVPNWQSHRVKKGDIIQFKPGNNGLRAYLAVAKGFHSLRMFAAFTEVPREQLFDLQIREKANLIYSPISISSRRITATPERFIPDYQSELILRTFASYQNHNFSEESKTRFCENSYSVKPQSDRMAYRLSGAILEWQHGSLLSEGVALGSVQIPADGQPIVLLNDRQTIGGYPKMGVVCQKDCSQLAQRRAGQKIRFETVDLAGLLPKNGIFNWLHPSSYSPY